MQRKVFSAEFKVISEDKYTIVCDSYSSFVTLMS